MERGENVMPIRPENVARYPKDWPDIRARIRERSGNRCECTGECGQPHLDSKDSRCPRWHMELIENKKGNEICVILTVAHLDHQPEHNDDSNLRHMCQGCHNRYDMPMRRAGIKERARAKMAVADMFECK